MIRKCIFLLTASASAVKINNPAGEEGQIAEPTLPIVPTVAPINAPKPPATCHALALSAAESNGAFQAGAIYSLINYGNSLDFEWDVVTGLSFGAMNAAIVGAFPKG